VNRSTHVAVIAGTFALSLPGCERSTPPPAPSAERVEPAAPVPSDSTRLPEDAAAGRRAEAQWREHMADEERERQMGFDRRHVAGHHAVVALLLAARARYDKAHTQADVERVRTDMPRAVDEVRRRVTAIDRQGVNSRLLGDYAELEASLVGDYASARVSAVKGDPGPLEKARATFDERMRRISSWLDEAAETENE
jgi:hypothetical protein